MKLKKLKKTFDNFIELTTIQGIPQIFKSEKFSFKLMWTVLFVISSISCSYCVVDCFVDFFNYEYFTSISSIYDIPAPFPAITICGYQNREFNFTQLRLKYNSENLTNWENHFESYIDQMYGKCYRFNSGKNLSNQIIPIKQIVSTGIYFGFWFEIYVNNTKEFNEVLVYVHNQTQIPVSLYNKGHYLSSGSYNYFTIERTYEEKLPLPYNECYKDVSLFPLNHTLINFIKDKGQKYSQNACIDLCRTMHYIETNNKCPNCTLSSYDDIIYAKCSYGVENDARKCALGAIENFQKNLLSVCAEFCPLECDSISYEIQHSHEYVRSFGKIKNSFEFPEFNTYENVSSSFFSMFFYYKDLKYTFITQQPKMKIFDLISSIGGLFGLFLGMGLLSFIEIFQVLFQIFVVIVRD